MKQLLLILSMLAYLHSTGQTDNLQEFNRQREKYSRNGMFVLGGWAVGNIAVSGIEFYKTTGVERSFHQMNVIWNSVNAALATAGILSKPKQGITFGQSMHFQMQTEKLFLINAALDLAYSGAGLYLTEYARNDKKNYDRFTGWGESLVLQGGFLLLFDSTMFAIHSTHGKKHLYPMLDHMNFSTSGLGMRITIAI